MKSSATVPKVRDRMSIEPYTVRPDDSLQTAIDLLRRYAIRELPVIEDGTLVGIVTDRDLRQVAPSYPLFRDEAEIRHYTRNLKVMTAMTPDPLVVGPDTPLIEAAKLLQKYRITALPVVEGRRLVGIISVTDLLAAFIELQETSELKKLKRSVRSDKASSLGSLARR